MRPIWFFSEARLPAQAEASASLAVADLVAQQRQLQRHGVERVLDLVRDTAGEPRQRDRLAWRARATGRAASSPARLTRSSDAVAVRDSRHLAAAPRPGASRCTRSGSPLLQQERASAGSSCVVRRRASRGVARRAGRGAPESPHRPRAPARTGPDRLNLPISWGSGYVFTGTQPPRHEDGRSFSSRSPIMGLEFRGSAQPIRASAVAALLCRGRWRRLRHARVRPAGQPPPATGGDRRPEPRPRRSSGPAPTRARSRLTRRSGAPPPPSRAHVTPGSPSARWATSSCTAR